MPLADHSQPNPAESVVRTLAVKLSIPDPDEECSLTLEPINASRLNFLPDCNFIENKPEFSKMTLPCGHSFSAMPLVYHMCKNNMLCPCCRAGLNTPASYDSIPLHFRSKFQEHIGDVLEEEQAIEDNATLQELITLQEPPTSFTQLAEMNGLTMSVSFVNPGINSPSRNRTLATIVLGLNLYPCEEIIYGQAGSRIGSRTIYRPHPNQLSLLRHVREVSSAVRITAIMETSNMGAFAIERTHDIVIPNVPGPNTPLMDIQPGQMQGQQQTRDYTSISMFETTFSRDAEGVYISNLGWIPRLPEFHWAITIDPAYIGFGIIPSGRGERQQRQPRQQ